DAGVRHVAVACDLVGRVHDDHTLFKVVGEHARSLTEQRRFPDARTSHQQYAPARFDQIANDVHHSKDRAPHPAGQSHDLAQTIADRRDSVQRALDARAVVAREMADTALGVMQIFARHDRIVDGNGAPRIARFRLATEIKDDLYERFEAFLPNEGL